eukprot:CAMPEP_0181520152 /NCGR_PEP_ID=MMETSP1110-20121109/66158_1 /TAXON_ID=174948 /ORGANISM="Symbiodinium sp., Strain CCMP421" /LENGTH=107 /DNA_ID=CAMNT_0023650623 /DNA_START=54 /DNA_END=378 /DNA_ORIENTATION=-
MPSSCKASGFLQKTLGQQMCRFSIAFGTSLCCTLEICLMWRLWVVDEQLAATSWHQALFQRHARVPHNEPSVASLAKASQGKALEAPRSTVKAQLKATQSAEGSRSA